MAGVLKNGARLSALLGLASLLASTAFAQHYTRTDLTTDSSSVSAAPVVDPNLVNAWGLSRGTDSPWWVADNGTGVSTLYDGTGAIVPLVVTIPPPLNQKGTSAPTGTVHYSATAKDKYGRTAEWTPQGGEPSWVTIVQ